MEVFRAVGDLAFPSLDTIVHVDQSARFELQPM